METSSDDSGCRLCETLRIPSRGSTTVRSATAGELEAASSSCSLCRILLQVIQHFSPDLNVREKGILKIVPVPEYTIHRPNTFSVLSWLPEPWNKEDDGIPIEAFRIDGMCVSDDAIVVCSCIMRRKSSC